MTAAAGALHLHRLIAAAGALVRSGDTETADKRTGMAAPAAIDGARGVAKTAAGAKGAAARTETQIGAVTTRAGAGAGLAVRRLTGVSDRKCVV